MGATLKGRALVGLGDNKSAMTAFNQAIDMKQGIGEPYYQKAMLNLEIGKKEEACKDLGLAAKLEGGKYIELYHKQCQ
ncbi:MAG: hypothetical protein JKY54_07250 [Flavobacteriales bacterium]|nr:hypothetical protein [Flavobacteriales bacterium]